jgi:hypothetical protein
MTSPATGSGAEARGSEGRDAAFSAILNTEYAHLSESLLRNEEDGEKRVTFFLKLTSGIIAVVGFLVRPTEALSRHANVVPPRGRYFSISGRARSSSRRELSKVRSRSASS